MYYSEFEIQAQAYILLQEAYPQYWVRGEYKYKNARFDIAILCKRSKKILAVIEIKHPLKRPCYRNGEPKERAVNQLAKYEQLLGFKPVLIEGMVQALNIVEILSKKVAL